MEDTFVLGDLGFDDHVFRFVFPHVSSTSGAIMHGTPDPMTCPEPTFALFWQRWSLLLFNGA